MRTGDAIALSFAGLSGGFGLLLVLGSKGWRPEVPAEWVERLKKPWDEPRATPTPIVAATPPETTRFRPPVVPEARPKPTLPPSPSVDPDLYREHVGSLREFQRVHENGQYRLSYGFIDHHGKTHRVSCTVSKAAHEHELAGFGYDEEDIKAVLQAYLDEELRARDLTRYLRATASGLGGWSYEGQLPGGLDWAERERRLAEVQAFVKVLENEFPKKRHAVFKERGFLYDKDEISIDHAGMVVRSTEHVRDCFRALETSGAGYNERQYLGLFVAFFQEIPYTVPPDRIGTRDVQGFWVPTEVLVNNHGDCDSKSAAFAAMWRNFRSAVLLIDLPDHLLVGVEVRPRAGDKYVLVRNRYFVLGEVAGPGKTRPGETSHKVWTQMSGHFGYTMVNPAGREP